MDVQQDQRISKLLPTVKCSDCGETVEFRRLGDHLCQVVPAVPELPLNYKNNNNMKIGKGPVPSSKKLQPNLTPLFVDNGSSYDVTPSPMDSEHSDYSNKFAAPTANPAKNKPARSFMQKYQQVTGKPTNSPPFQPPLTPTSERIYSDLQDRSVNNSDGNGVYYKDVGAFDNKMMQKNQGYGNGYQTDRERQPPDTRKMAHVRPFDKGHEYPSYDNHQNQYRNEDPYRTKQRQPNNNYLNDNMDRGQGNYLRNPNDSYVNGEHMRREEPRSRSRSPAPGYDRQNFPQSPPLNHSYGGAPQPLRQAPYDRHDGQLPYGHDNYRSQSPRIPPQSPRILPQSPRIPPQSPRMPPQSPRIPPQEKNSNSSYVSNKNDEGHKSKNASFSSTGSSVSGQKYADNRNTNSSKDSFKGDFDDLMEDLLREMDNMQTPSAQKGNLEQKSSHSKSSSLSEKQTAQSDICAYCNLQINSSPMWALGRSWHSHHLLCAKCKKPIDPDVGHVEQEGKVYCPSDFTDLFLPKCRRCNLPVEREAISASDGKLQGKWHVKCFSCHTCSKEFPDGSFYVFENAPYCKRHYHKLNNSLCGGCNEPIEGPCAETDEGWRYHPTCFVCTECRNPLTDIYYSFENKYYCETHIMEIQRRRNFRAKKRQTLFRNL